MKNFFLEFLDKNKILTVSLCILFAVVAFFIVQKNSSVSLNGMLKTGERYEKSGKLALALQIYNKAVRSYPGSYEAHLRLGNVFRQVNELEKAKLEYYRAIKMTSVNRYDAYFAMADIYVSQDDYDIAQDFLTQIQNIPQKTVSNKIGDFYFNWGNKFQNSDPPEAIRKYKLAYDFYSRCNNEKVTLARAAIENTYSDIVDSLLAENNADESIKILNDSINYFDNATAHYKLARIYEKKNIDKAITEYTKAFALNSSIAPTDGFSQLLVKKADNLYKNGDKLTAKIYYEKAKNLDAKIIIPYINDDHIIVNLLASKSNKDSDKHLYTPGISFKITNISKNKIEYLKAKVVFNINDEKYSEEIQEISTQKDPLAPFSITPVINIYSSKPVSYEYQYAKPKIEVLVYISQKPDKWKLFRSTNFEDNSLIKDPEKTKTKNSKANSLSKNNNCEAYFAMIDLYVSRNEYSRAQNLLAQIQDIHTKTVSNKIGDFYFNWGNKFKNSDPPEAIRKYKLAYKFYSKYKGDKVSLTRKTIENTYANAADSLLAINKVDESIKLLNDSIDYRDNATAHYKLARIYENKSIDKAITEYTKAYKLNSSTAPVNGLTRLLLKKADNLYKSGDKLAAKLYYEKAKKLDSKIKIPSIEDNRVIVNLLASKSSNNSDKHLYTPGISFKITNISKSKLEYLKAKVVFNVNDKKYSEEIREISNMKNPLSPSSSTSVINIYSSKPVSYEYQYVKPKIESVIYISQQPDKWKLFSSMYLKDNTPTQESEKNGVKKSQTLSKNNNCEAYFAMIDLYVSRNEYSRAQNLLAQIQDIHTKTVSNKIGDFYFNWGNKFKNSDPPEAIRKYKLAYKFYSKYKGDKVSLTRKTIENTYANAADSLLAINKVDESIKLLNDSIDYRDNATAHYKLARIYENKSIDKAITEYTKAYKLNSSTAPVNGLTRLLLKKADNLYKSGDKLAAKLYYEKAKKLDSKIKIPSIEDNRVIVNLLASKSSNNSDKHLYTPGISFKITNISKSKLEYLKAKVVFNVNDKKYSEEIREISNKKNPLSPSSSTSVINIYSSKPVSNIFGSPNGEIFIYISQQPDKWKLFRSTNFEDHK